MEFPRFVYRAPGPIRYSGGASYRYVVVSSQEEYDRHLNDGWFSSEKKAIDYVGDEAYLYGLNDHDRAVMKEILAKKAKEKIKAAPPPPVLVSLEESDDNAPPTRGELEEKATQLGVRFDGRTTDAKLVERINRALRG